MTATATDDLTKLLGGWPGRHCFAVANPEGVLGLAGDLDQVERIASVTKLFTSYAALIALEEGTITLDDPAGPPGSTVRHLLAHASGLGFDDTNTVAAVGTRRIYSNTGIETLAAHIETRAGLAFDDYLYEGVLLPVGLGHVEPVGSPAHGLSMSVRSLITFGRELLSPTLVAPATLELATQPVFPGLRGVLPGFGALDPNPWGLGFEIKGAKYPHWTGARQAPETFGHFGGSGSFLWVDPVNQLIGASVGDVAFGEWATSAWPSANAAAFDRYRTSATDDATGGPDPDPDTTWE